MDQSGAPTSYEQHDVTVTGWTDENGDPLQLTVVTTPDGRAFFPIGMLCTKVLYVDPRTQLDRLREHAVLSQLVFQFRLNTAGGPQLVWCIERRGVGFWWGSIQLSKVREDVRVKLLEYQWALVDAADRLMYGEARIDPTRGQLVTHETQIADATRFALALEKRIGRLETKVFHPED